MNRTFFEPTKIEVEDMMMGSMGLMMLIGTLVLFALIAAAVYVGVRLARGTGSGASAQAVLDGRFASGEISAEEYYERESALRSAGGSSGKGRHGLA